MNLTRPRSITALTLSAGTLAATGCAMTNPYDKPITTTATAAAAAPTLAPAATTPAAASTSTSASAAQAIRRFASAFINWRFDQLPKQRAALAAMTTGDLAREMSQASAQALTEVSRRESNQANTGTVQAIAEHNGRFLVVTHETAALGDSHDQSAYMVYEATARKTASGYKLDSFKALS